jgi:hypothetical protein
LSPMAPAGHIFVNLVKHVPNVVPHGTSWSHFGQLGQTCPQCCSPWHQLVTFRSTWSNAIPILSPLVPASTILVDLVKCNPNFFHLAPASHILVDLIKHKSNFVPVVTFWLSCSDAIPILSTLASGGHILVKSQFCPTWHYLVPFGFTWSNTIPILSPLALTGHIFFYFVKHNPNVVPLVLMWLTWSNTIEMLSPLAPARHILVDRTDKNDTSRFCPSV